MPIGIGVQGGITRNEALQNIDKVDSQKALDTLQQIKTHLSQPGRDSGVLTLFNRTNSGSEMTLERKNGFQLLFQDDKRLNDTVRAMQSLLETAGKYGALTELDHYLVFGKGDRNRIESGKMLEILNRHLPPPGSQGGDQTRVESGKAPETLDSPPPPPPDIQGGDQKLVESGKVSETVDPPVPPPDGQDGEQKRLEPGKMLESLRPVLPPPGSSKEEVYLSCGLEKLQELKSGAFGTTSLIKYGDEQLILKEMNDVKPVHRDRRVIDKNNEAMGAFLGTGRNSDLLKSVNITQPISFLVSVKNEGKDEFRLLDSHTLRSLLKLEEQKDQPSEILCHGLVMPKAKGERVRELFEQGGLSEPQQKDLCRSTLLSIKGLNERGFVHRDLKPDNAFFDPENGTTTFIDTGTLFKESKHKDREDRPQYIAGDGMGTWQYMHPRARMGNAHGTETDLYALAVMTMEMAHPKAWTDFRLMTKYPDVPPQNQDNDMTWMRGSLDRKIEALKVQETNAKPGDEKTQLKEKREGLEALRRDMDDPNTPTNFAVECFEKTRVSSEEWHDRTKSQEMYSELQEHPFIKQQSL